jgi:hypothetical protein
MDVNAREHAPYGAGDGGRYRATPRLLSLRIAVGQQALASTQLHSIQRTFVAEHKLPRPTGA